jgi:hypothetical protein
MLIDNKYAYKLCMEYFLLAYNHELGNGAESCGFIRQI